MKEYFKKNWSYVVIGILISINIHYYKRYQLMKNVTIYVIESSQHVDSLLHKIDKHPDINVVK